MRALLDGRPDWEISGEAATGVGAVRKAKALQPDVVVLAVSLPDRSGIDVIPDIRQASPKTEILVLTMHDSGEVARKALVQGAGAVVLKSDASRHVLLALNALKQHRRFLSPRVKDIISHLLAQCAGQKSPLETLTRREREILHLLAEGKTIKEVAAGLDISPKTADVHRAHLMQKLTLRSRGELIRYSIRNRLVTL